MLDIPFTRIIEGLNHTLENVVAPEVDSTIARGQLFAVTEILRQISGRFDYKHDHTVQDIQVSQQMLATLTDALRAASIEIPDDFQAGTEAVDATAMSAEQLRAQRDQLEQTVSVALDLLNTHRSKIPDAQKIEHTVFMQLGPNIYRNMLLVSQHRFDKISQVDKES